VAPLDLGVPGEPVTSGLEGKAGFAAATCAMGARSHSRGSTTKSMAGLFSKVDVVESK
jgi:hypothetical protein